MTSFLKSLRPGVLIGLILGLTFLIYSPVLFHEFVNWDDNTHITDNPQVRSLSPENLQHMFTSRVQRTYIPLSMLSFAVEYRLAGLNPFLFHLDNVLLHLMVVFLIFRLGLALGLSEKGAGVAAFIFALHPMHVESVAWATGRKDVLYSSFYLGSVLWYLSFLRTKKTKDFGFSLVLGFLSILAKPMALSLPLVLLLCDWFVKGPLKKEDWLNKLPYLLFIVPLAWITYSINMGIVGQNPGPGMLLRFWSGAFYLKKFFWPVFLVPQYMPALPISLFRFEYWNSVLVVAASIFAFWRWPNRWLRLALLWYILSIFFILNFDYGRVLQLAADRFMYLPSAGICFFLGYCFENVRATKFSPAVGKIILIGLVLIALFLPLRTFKQIGLWKDSFTLWNYTAQHSPRSYVAFNNRGRIYERRKQYDLAMADYKETIRLNPNYAKAHKNLGMIYENLGETEAAIASYTNAVKVKPNYSGAYNNRGLLLQKRGDNVGALTDFDRAVTADPQYILGYLNRGNLYVALGKWESALSDFNRMSSLNPGYLDAYLGRAICYSNMNLSNKALQECQLAVKLSRSHPSVVQACSEIYKKIQDPSGTPVKRQATPEPAALPMKNENMDAFQTQLEGGQGEDDVDVR